MSSLPVLIVEDKDSLRTMLRLALEAHGHAVHPGNDDGDAEPQLITVEGVEARPAAHRERNRLTEDAVGWVQRHRRRGRQAAPPGGKLGEALRNLQKYVDQESFDNQRGSSQEFGPLQFDTKGVEFGPWVRRFVAQVRRNWFVPYAAMSLRGRVVITFFVHRNGALTDVTVVSPSPVESFNLSARNALLASNPTEPLPPEYPDDRAFFTVTFYYNESPDGRQ